MTITAKVIADSVNANGDRLTTFEVRYPRFVHAETLTHRSFCLSGDAVLDFDLPGAKGKFRRYQMSLREFATKWHGGAREGKAPRFLERSLDNLVADQEYTSAEIAAELGFGTRSGALNANTWCRDGKVVGAYKKHGSWVAKGAAWRACRENMGRRRFSIQERLSKMRIRQVNERTGEVSFSRVVDCIVSGVKPVFCLAVGRFSVTATADHRIFTKAGWKRLGDLQVGVDEVCVYRYGTGANSDPYRKIDGTWVAQWCRQVRDEVSAHQNMLCAVSGKPLERGFHIHHVTPRHERPDLAFDMGNVVAVNADVHRQLHQKQGWQRGVPLLTEFLPVESIEPAGEVDTYDLEIAGEFPNFFANGVVVHNSRNASSSRAIPMKKLIADIRRDPAMPVHWGQNRPGMQATEQLSGWRLWAMKKIWMSGMYAATFVAGLADRIGAHKQLGNRIIENFGHITVVITATNYSNFYALRRHKDAQPEIKTLADAMFQAQAASVPRVLRRGEWHLPYITCEDGVAADHWLADHGSDISFRTLNEEDRLALGISTRTLLLIGVSVARCARTSYTLHDGQKTTFDKDFALYQRLLGADPVHASPAEHQAMADTVVAGKWEYPELHGNLSGFIQYRKLLPGECQ